MLCEGMTKTTYPFAEWEQVQQNPNTSKQPKADSFEDLEDLLEFDPSLPPEPLPFYDFTETIKIQLHPCALAFKAQTTPFFQGELRLLFLGIY